LKYCDLFNKIEYCKRRNVKEVIMGPFLLGFLVAALIGVTLVYNCYSKREITEKRLRQNIGNLEHNLDVIKKESGVKIDQLTRELKKTKEDHRRALTDIDTLQKDLTSMIRELEDCRHRLGE